MERIYIFITACIAGVIATVATMLLGLHWSCMIGTILFVVALTLTADSYLRERKDKEELLIKELTEQKRAISEFTQVLGLDKARARQIYHTGYKTIFDLKEASVEELIQIEDINPTLAKKIIQRVNEL